MTYVIVSSVERLAKAFSIQLETKLGFETLVHTSLEQTRGMLEILPHIEGVVLLKAVPENNMNFFLKKVDLTGLKFLVPTDQVCESEVDRWNTEEEIFDLLVSKSIEDKPLEEVPEYCKVPISHMDILDVAPVDYYFMIGDQRKYLKVINSKEDNFKMALAKLASRKIKELYVKGVDLDDMLLEIKKITESMPSKNKIDHLKIQEEVFALMQSVGFSTQALQLATNSIGEIKKKLNSDVDTKTLLNTLYTKSSNKSYQLTYMTSIISVNVVSSFDWFQENMREVLINASFFNDTSLSGDQVFVRDLKALNSVEGTAQLDILEHAFKNSESLKSSNLNFLDATCKVICEHHGDKSGRGFGTDLTSLGKLSGIFIISEEFCWRMLNAENGKINVGSILKDISNMYKGKSVQAYCQAILNIFKAS
jgi:hypothetical protein